MSDMHQPMSIERICRELHTLHGEVIRNWGRIEITQDGQPQKIDDDACVLISRAELRALERALELFCESPAGKKICEELEGIAKRSTYRAGSAMSFAFIDPTAGDGGGDGAQPSL